MSNIARRKPKLNLKEPRCMVTTFGKVPFIQQLVKYMLNRLGLRPPTKELSNKIQAGFSHVSI